MAPKTEENETVYGYIDKYHASRRSKILDNCPELRYFMRIDPSFKYVAFCCAFTQILVAFLLRDQSIFFVMFMACCVGTVFNCAITNSVHETVHDLVFETSPLANKVFGNLVNFALAWPSCGGYYRTHRNHHSYLGSNLDAKYPSIEEATAYDQTIWTRLKFIFNHPLSFGARWSSNVKEEPTQFMIWNARTVWTFDFLFLVLVGWKSLLYLLVSFWLNDSIFIQGSKNFADHWVDTDGMAYTSSYYGIINKFNFNIGYHREHHDLPNIPGRYLAMVYNRATSYYKDKRFIADNLFGAVWSVLKAPPGQGLLKHANKAPMPTVTKIQ